MADKIVSSQIRRPSYYRFFSFFFFFFLTLLVWNIFLKSTFFKLDLRLTFLKKYKQHDARTTGVTTYDWLKERRHTLGVTRRVRNDVVSEYPGKPHGEEMAVLLRPVNKTRLLHTIFSSDTYD